MPLEILLIRHGVTSANKTRRYCGHTDVPLCSEGVKQAHKLRSKVNAMQISKIYSSDLSRALRTARIAFGRRRIKCVKSIREMDFGCFEGKKHEQLLNLPEKGAYKKWLKDPMGTHIPGGESMRDFSLRIRSFFYKLAQKDTGRIAVVCHGGVIAVLLASIKKKTGFWKFVPGSTSITVISTTCGKKWKIKKFNDISHLKRRHVAAGK